MLRTLGNRVRVRGGEGGEGMQMKAAIKLVLRPLSALSLVVPMFGMLGAVASEFAAGDANGAG